MGFKIRGSTGIDWLVLQLHYGDLPDNKHQFAGMYIIALDMMMTSLNAGRINQRSNCTID